MSDRPAGLSEKEVELGVALADEDHVEPARWNESSTFSNGVEVWVQLTARYSTAPKHPKLTHYEADYYARCPACGWTDHQPVLAWIRRHAHEHPCEASDA